MTAWALYLLLLRATVTSFSGLGSLPEIREELVVRRHVLSDAELNQTVLVTRVTPGPMGAYVVGVGYMVAGLAGALVGWSAMITPAILIVPILALARRTTHPRLRAAIDGVILANSIVVILTVPALVNALLIQFRTLI